MFKKLVSNLPYNPGLINQVSFYAKRLRQESAVRRMGLIFLALGLVIQSAAALYPAQKSLAASPNNILNGITTKKSILDAWDANTGNIQAIYGKFGVTRANIADIPGTTPNATISSGSDDFWSIGRLPLSNFGISGSKWGERDITLNDGGIVYQRPLQAWDKTSSSSSYKAFRGVNSHGVAFWILQECGNMTFKSPYIPSPPKPNLEVHKTRLTPQIVKPGDTVSFRIDYWNTISGSLGTNFRLSDVLNSNFDYVSLGNIDKHEGQTLTIQQNKIGHTSSASSVTLNVKVKTTVPNGTVICNQATVDTDETGPVSSEKPCVTVVTQTTPPTTTPVTPSTPVTPAAPEQPAGYCVATGSLVSGSSKDVQVRTQSFVQGTTKVEAYRYDIDANGSVDATDKSSAATDTKVFSGLANGAHQVSVTLLLSTQGGTVKTTSAACRTSVTINETPRVIQTKSVSNTTQNISNANGTKVHTGDTLVFHLNTQNVTSSDYKDYAGVDYIGDVLNYAAIDPAQLASQGITLDANNYLRWQSPLIAAGATETKTVSVKVKNVIPATNRPNNTSGDYDCIISNTYGNEVTMSVSCPLVKNIELASASIPNTGPGTGVMVGVSITIIAGYFFARSRLLAHELALIRHEYGTPGDY
jgi:hypothetical protein